MKTTRTPKSQETMVEKLVTVAREQQNTISELLSKIAGGTTEEHTRTKRKYTKRAHKEGAGEKQTARHTAVDYFLESLKSIGRPAMTQEIAQRLKKLHPELRKGKKFMQGIYSSASYLIKEKELKRKPVGKRSYEYALPEWKKNA